MNPAITFAIPFYRNTDLLRVAIESVQAQNRADWCLIVCDDSGTEQGAESVVQQLADDRIRYVRNPGNLGMVATWNRCLDAAETDLVSLFHADDLLRPGYAATMIELAATHPEATAFFCQCDIIDSSGKPRFSLADWVKGFLAPSARSGKIELRSEAAVAQLMAGYFIMTPSLCYRKSKLGTHRFDPSWHQVQDLLFVVGLLLDGHVLVGTPEHAYAYRRHEGSATSMQSESMLRFDEEVAAFDRVAEQAEAQGWHRAARVARHKNIIKLHLLYRSLRELTRFRFKRSLETLRYRADLD